MAKEAQGRGRPSNPDKKVELRLKIPRGLKAYLKEAGATHICGGNTVNEAAIYLLNEGVNRLIKQRKIGPRKIFEYYSVGSDPDPEDEPEKS